MKTKQKVQLKRVGMSFVFAGTIVVASPAISEASSSLGDQLLYEGKEDGNGDGQEDGDGDVGQLQKLLGEHGFLSEYMDPETKGIYDEDTTEAVTEFQAEHELLEDGIAGPQTIGALSILEYGDEGEVVSELQEDLEMLGHYDFKVDGIFGPITEEAVKDFQREHDIAVDGLAGPETFSTLHEVKQEKASSSSSKSNADSSGSGDSSEADNSDKDENDSDNNSDDSDSGESDENSADSGQSSAAEKEQSSSKSDSQTASSDSESTHQFQAEATAYTAYCEGCSGTTATGQDLRSNPDKKVIAVDPDIIPLGSTVEVEGYGTAIAGDTGGDINGNRIDVFIPNRDEALSWGRQTVTVRVLD